MAILHDTQRFLHFNLTHTNTGEDNHYVDIGKLLSQANRRSYRQGMVYHIANIVFDDADGDADIDVCTVPNTWVTQAAWEVGFKHWLAQQRAAMESVGEEDLGTWSDFKIALNADSRTDVDQATLIDVNGNTFPAGEWDYSQLVQADLGNRYNDGVAVNINMMGATAGTYPSYTTISLLDEFEQILRKPQADPEFAQGDVEDNFYSILSTGQNDPRVLEEVLDGIEDQNELPPYSAAVIPGAGTAGSGRPSSPWVARTCMIKGGSSTSSAVAAVGGFAAPCGLLMIETNSSPGQGSHNSIGVTIELVPGEYKGVHAYPMRGGGF